LNNRTGEVEIPDIGRLGLEGGRAVESSETSGKGKQRIEDGFFHDGLCVFFNASDRTNWRRRRAGSSAARRVERFRVKVVGEAVGSPTKPQRHQEERLTAVEPEKMATF
jgi:hypothetical protein